MENIILMGDLKRRVNEKREKVRGEGGEGEIEGKITRGLITLLLLSYEKS